MSDKLVLHGYWRSSSAHHLRIALDLPGRLRKSRPVNSWRGSVVEII